MASVGSSTLCLQFSPNYPKLFISVLSCKRSTFLKAVNPGQTYQFKTRWRYEWTAIFPSKLITIHHHGPLHLVLLTAHTLFHSIFIIILLEYIWTLKNIWAKRKLRYKPIRSRPHQLPGGDQTPGRIPTNTPLVSMRFSPGPLSAFR